MVTKVITDWIMLTGKMFYIEYRVHIHTPTRLPVGNKSTMVKVRERSWSWLNKNVVTQVTADFLCIKPDHDLT